MGGDLALQSLCVGVAWWMLGRLWVMSSWCLVIFGLGVGGSHGVGFRWMIGWLLWFSLLLLVNIL